MTGVLVTASRAVYENRAPPSIQFTLPGPCRPARAPPAESASSRDAKRCFSWAPARIGAKRTTVTRKNLESLCIRAWEVWKTASADWGIRHPNRYLRLKLSLCSAARSGTPLGRRVGPRLLAAAAESHSAESADDTNECSAVDAWITLRGALLVVARSAYHRIAFPEYLAHLPSLAIGPRAARVWLAQLQQQSLRPLLPDTSGRLQPDQQLLGAAALPSLWHRDEPPFLAVTLEAEPATIEFGGDGDATAKWIPAPLGRHSPVRRPLNGVRTSSHRTAVGPPPLRRRRRHLPDFPPPSCPVEKRPITHRQVLPGGFLPHSKYSPHAMHGKCQTRRFFQGESAPTLITCLRHSELTIPPPPRGYLMSSFLPTSR